MQKIIKSKYFWLLLGQLLIISVSLLNTFPKGYVFSGGDVAQYFDSSYIIKNFFYTWNSAGEGSFLQVFSYSLFYYPFLLLSNFLRLSPSNQSFLYFFIFLSGSFWSFYFGSKLYKKDIDIKYHIFFSFLYSFNAYVFNNNFFSAWGYTPFLFLYVLIPLIFGLTYNFFALQNKINFKILSLLGLVFFLTNIPNGNMSFFISLNILLFLFLIFMFICDKTIDKINFLKKIFFYYVIYYFAVFWSVVPQIIELLKLAKIFINNESFFNIGDWITWQAVKLPNVFFFTFSIQGFINNFSFLGYFSFSLFLVLLLSLIFGKKQKDILVINYLFLLLVCIFLLNKGNGILDCDVILNIFTRNPILASLRSYDKTIIFLPFFVLILTFLKFEKIGFKNKIIFVCLLTLSLLSVYPFFTGGIQTEFSSIFKKGENYLSAKYSYLHKIPDEYFKAAEFINSKNLDVKNLSIPYNVVNSIGWVNFPKWKQVGVDPTIQLFNNSTVQMNSFGAFGIWSYGEFWNKQGNNESVWLFPFSGLLNIKYIIYHKDVEEQFLRQTKNKIRFYEKNNLLTKLNSNYYFELYEINTEYFLPHFYVPQNIIYSNGGVEAIPEIISSKNYELRSGIYLDGMKETANVKETIKKMPKITFIKINPTKYRVKVEEVVEPYTLIFSESFHEGWKAYLVQDQKLKVKSLKSKFWNVTGKLGSKITGLFVKNKGYGEEVASYFDGDIKEGTHQMTFLEPATFETWGKKPIPEERHVLVNGYANSWYITPEDAGGRQDYEIIIEFEPQRLFYIGLTVSAFTFLGCLCYLVYGLCMKKKRLKVKQVNLVYKS